MANSSPVASRYTVSTMMQEQEERVLLLMVIIAIGGSGVPVFLPFQAGVLFMSVRGQLNFYLPGKVTTGLTISMNKGSVRRTIPLLSLPIVQMEQMVRGRHSSPSLVITLAFASTSCHLQVGPGSR